MRKLKENEYGVKKGWYLIETKDGGDTFETALKAKTKNEAIKEAKRIWDSLSTFDQKHRTDFYICFAEADEDGIVDLDSATDTVDMIDYIKDVNDKSIKEELENLEDTKNTVVIDQAMGAAEEESKTLWDRFMEATKEPEDAPLFGAEEQPVPDEVEEPKAELKEGWENIDGLKFTRTGVHGEKLDDDWIDYGDYLVNKNRLQGEMLRDFKEENGYTRADEDREEFWNEFDKFITERGREYLDKTVNESLKKKSNKRITESKSKISRDCYNVLLTAINSLQKLNSCKNELINSEIMTKADFETLKSAQYILDDVDGYIFFNSLVESFSKLTLDESLFDSKKSNKRNLKEEVSDYAYELAAEIDKRFRDEGFISLEDFNEVYEDWFEYDKANLDDDQDLWELENDVRGILSYMGWETIFEGEDEGSLKLLESKKRISKKNLKEASTLPKGGKDASYDIDDWSIIHWELSKESEGESASRKMKKRAKVDAPQKSKYEKVDPVGDFDLRVYAKDESGFDLAKKVADAWGIKYDIKPTNKTHAEKFPDEKLQLTLRIPEDRIG